MATPAKKKKNSNAPERGIAHVLSSYNNTMITVTGPNGNTISWSSGGRFDSNARKGLGHAAEQAGKQVGTAVFGMGMREVVVRIKGNGSGRDSAVRGLAASGLKILSLVECTPDQHGGCRRKKQKRV